MCLSYSVTTVLNLTFQHFNGLAKGSMRFLWWENLINFLSLFRPELIRVTATQVYIEDLISKLFSKVKFIYSKKATKFREILDFYGGDFANICGLPRIYEL